MRLMLMLIPIILMACSNFSTMSEKTNGKSEIPTTVDPKSDTGKINDSTLLGIWTDGQTENATFQIKQDSIFYVDHLENYHYRLESDSIFIHYPDLLFKAKILLKHDTLILKAPDAEYKYWKFK